MLSDFGLLRNGSLATLFIHFSGTATSYATSEYGIFPEHIGQNEEPAGRNEERARNKHSSAPKMHINEP